MKKLLAIVLALMMVLSLAACGGDGDTQKTDPPTDPPKTDGSTEPPVTEPPAAEDLPANPLYYNGFETTDGLTAVHRVDKSESPKADAANYGIAPSVHEIMQVNGVDGKAVAVDGKYGISFDNFPTTSDDSYTIAFWYAADRYGLYMPILQMGRNVGGKTNSTYINFTRTNWGVGGVDCAPVAWSRNSDTNPVNPWMGNNIDEKGKKEWIHVVLVVDGVEYMDADPTNGPCPHVGATMYVNGVEVMKADASVIGTKDEAGVDTSANWMGIAPHMIDSAGEYGLECYFGINYWDSLFKGYMDEFYLYDEALTPGQVTALYTKNTAPAYEKFPDYTGPVDEEAPEPETPTLPEITPDASAIDVLGTTARDNGFWSDTTAGYELKDGTPLTIKLHNYSDGAAVFDNVVFAFSNTAVTTDKVASADNYPGYAEYAVFRPDGDMTANAAWGAEGFTVNYEKTWDNAAYIEAMKDAELTVVLTRNGTELTADITITPAAGDALTEKVTLSSNFTAESPMFVHMTNEKSYVEILSVE